MKAFILALLLIVLIVIPCRADFIRGDANDDGMVTVADVLLIKQYLARFDVEINYEAAASVDANHPTGHPDIVGMCDVLFIMQYLAGLRDSDYNWIGG